MFVYFVFESSVISLIYSKQLVLLIILGALTISQLLMSLTILPVLMPAACQEFAFWIGEGKGVERKKEMQVVSFILGKD
jgi:hypothetical protein